MPMPWGNSRLVTDPCRQWGVFKHLSNLTIKRPLPQLSILKEKDSVKEKKIASNLFVYSILYLFMIFVFILEYKFL